MADETLKARIMDLLEPGQIVTTQRLMDETGLSRRELQKTIHDLRLDGHLICSRTSDGGGYWLAGTGPEGLEEYVASMTKRGKATFAAASAARKRLKQIKADGTT